jgi:ABC-type polysaccharide/polyol phosphate export permease
MNSPFEWGSSVKDIIDGFRRYHLWMSLGWQDIRVRYRRSTLGPLWITLSLSITVGAMGWIFGNIFKMDLAVYFPYLATSFVIWSLFSSLVTESGMSLIAAEGMIKQVRLPLTVHACRMVWRNFAIFSHNALVIILVTGWFGSLWQWEALLFIPALAIFAINAVWLGLLLGCICARFRDIQQVVVSLLQVLMFITPVMWTPDMLSNRHMWVADFNLLYHWLEFIRNPVLGKPISADTLIVVASTTIIGWTVTIGFLARFRKRVTFWL